MYYLRQYAGVRITMSVKISKRPANIAKIKIHLLESGNKTKPEPANPIDWPAFEMQADKAPNAVVGSIPVANNKINSTRNRLM